MADYQLSATETILRTADQVWIPPDPANPSYAEYLAWVEGGGVPDPYVPAPPPGPTAEQAILFDHENRIRTFEGEPPLTYDEFKARAHL